LEQLVAVTRGKEVEPQRKRLAELYPRRAEFLKRDTQPDGSRPRAKARELELRQNTVSESGPKDLDQATECLHCAEDPEGSRTGNRVEASAAVKGDRPVPRQTVVEIPSRGHEIRARVPRANDGPAARPHAERLAPRRRPYRSLNAAP
jgi:hypothetical protein